MLKVSPRFCNEDRCLSYEERKFIEDSLDIEFQQQLLYVYRFENGKYCKKWVYEVPIDQFYFGGFINSYFISNDGQTVIMEDQANISWSVFKLVEQTFSVNTFRGEELFGLKQKEYERCLEEVHGYATKMKGLCKIWTRVKDSLKIKIRFYDMNKQKYVYKKTEVKFD